MELLLRGKGVCTCIFQRRFECLHVVVFEYTRFSRTVGRGLIGTAFVLACVGNLYFAGMLVQKLLQWTILESLFSTIFACPAQLYLT
eukprot:UN16532